MQANPSNLDDLDSAQMDSVKQTERTHPSQRQSSTND